MPKVASIILGYTTLAAWRKCPQYFSYAYLSGLRRAHPLSTYEKGSPLEFGQALHKGLETYYSPLTREETVAFASEDGKSIAAVSRAQVAVEAATMCGMASSLTNTAPDAPRSIAHIGALMSAYTQRYPLNAETFTVTDVEKEIDIILQEAAPDQPKIIWRVHIDGIIRMADGTTAIIEHKTTSGNPAESLIDRMLPNDQAVGYSAALGGAPVLFNGICSDRAALERYLDPAKRAAYVKRTHKEPFNPFLRHLVTVEPWMITRWKENVLRDVTRLIEDIETGSFSMNAPDACTLFNSRCQFSDLCKVNENTRVNLIEHCYDISPWHGFSVEYE